MIPPILDSDLSIDAQFRMSPQGRPRVLPHEQEGKPAAVAITVLNWGKEPYIPLIQRPEYNGTHSAQISFPGGKPERQDSDLQETAIRECWEEIGLDLHQDSIHHIGKISPLFIPPSKFWVHPFVFFSQEDFLFTPQESEVDRILQLPIDALLSGDLQVNETIELSSGIKYKVPAYKFDGALIWGATAMMLSEFHHILKSKIT